MRRVFFLIFLAVAASSHATQLPRGFEEHLLVYGLKLPVAAEYAPDGRLFILEKEGRIRIFKEGRLLPTPFLTLRVNSLSERGLLGIAFDPQFASNGSVYIYRTTAANDPKNTVERYTARGDQIIPGSRKLILSGIRSDAGFHNGGDIEFGPDGKLYVSTGDGGTHSELAQQLSSYNGKILRMNSDGTAPADNPVFNDPNAKQQVFCYGFRNPWRFAIQPQTGAIVVGDVGGSAFEEINICRAGGNYGWPLAEGPSTAPDFINPIYAYDHQSGGGSVIVGSFYTGNKFPVKYRGRLFFTDYVRKFIKSMLVSESPVVENFATDLPAVSHLSEAPDGSLIYVAIHNGEVRSIRYVGGTNRQPVAEARASNRSGPVPLAVQFSSKGTFDPDGGALSYSWDFGDGAQSTAKNPSHTYTSKGTYFAVLTVRDNKGSTNSSRSIRISAGNTAPSVTITSPEDGEPVRLGQVVQLRGRATDAEEGQIRPENLKWNVKLVHNDHVHPYVNGVIGSSTSFTVILANHEEGNLSLRIVLQAMDSEGLSGLDTIHVPIAP